MKNKGQSLIEVVFSIGILAMVLVAVVSLLVTSMSGENSGFERKKAQKLAETVVEEQISQSKSDPLIFWQLQNLENQTKSGYSGYVYSVRFTSVGDCVDCAEMVVRVGWSGKEDNELIFNRFFSRK